MVRQTSQQEVYVRRGCLLYGDKEIEVEGERQRERFYNQVPLSNPLSYGSIDEDVRVLMIQSPPKVPTSEHCCIGNQAFNT
jgi:hypothetical protein